MFCFILGAVEAEILLFFMICTFLALAEVHDFKPRGAIALFHEF